MASAWKGRATRRSEQVCSTQEKCGASHGTSAAPLDYRCGGFPLLLADDVASYALGRSYAPAFMAGMSMGGMMSSGSTTGRCIRNADGS